MKLVDDFVDWLYDCFHGNTVRNNTIMNSTIIGNKQSVKVNGNKATVNGKTVTIPRGCNSLVINNGEIWVDGKKLSEEDGVSDSDKVINLTIEGNVQSIRIDSCDTLSVEGNSGEIGTNSGSVTVKGSVSGKVSSTTGEIYVGEYCKEINTNSGDIEIGAYVIGDINTNSGDVDIGGDVEGSITTGSGDVDIDGNVDGNVQSRSGDISHR